MADEDDEAIWGMLESGPAVAPARGPCPPRGRDKEFDRYCNEVIQDVNPSDDIYEELRKATWMTWKTKPPTGLSGSARNNEDDDLAKAIALSQQDMQGQPSTSRRNEVITVDDDDEELRRALLMSQEEAREPKRARRDETPEEERLELEKALKASLAGQEDNQNEEKPQGNDLYPMTPGRKALSNITTTPRSKDPSTPAAPASPLPSVLSDRAAMEKERLERQAAREALAKKNGSAYTVTKMPAPPPSRASGSGGITTFADIENRPSGSSTSKSRPTRRTAHPLQSPGPFPRDAAGEYYLDGEMRHTTLVIGEEPSEPTFMPQDVFGKHSEISLLILSSFVMDDDWAVNILPDPVITPTIMIRPHPKSEPTWNGRVQAQEDHTVRCYPRMIGEYGSAHMKFAWIFYKTGRLRVSIMTANLVPYDWDWIENTIFIQDFLPVKTTVNPYPTRAAKDFANQFRDLFIHLKVHKALRYLHDQHPQRSVIPFKVGDELEDLNKWDWSKVRVRLVLSVPGTYEGVNKMKEYGICRIGSVLEEEGWVPDKGEIVKAEYQGSSLGQYSLDWFDTFYQNCSGKNLQAIINKPKPKAYPPIKIIFPTEATVKNSLLGKDGGGTMFCSKAMNSVTRPLFHDANSKRGGVLMHAKVLIATFEPRPDKLGFGASTTANPSNGKRKHEDIQGDIGGWAYVGSHNFSGAAWGTVNVKKTPTLNIRNYEIGVIFPLPRANVTEAANASAPHKRPARPYSVTDIPWDQSTHIAASDGH